MSSFDTLRQLVETGCNVTIMDRHSQAHILELCEIATKSGSKITISTNRGSNQLIEIATKFGPKVVSFIEPESAE